VLLAVNTTVATEVDAPLLKETGEVKFPAAVLRATVSVCPGYGGVRDSRMVTTESSPTYVTDGIPVTVTVSRARTCMVKLPGRV
jgi:hypothetical protein